MQSKAMLRHVGRKYKLYGATEAEMARVDMALDEQEEWRAAFAKLVWVDNKAPEKVAEYIAKVTGPSGYVTLLENFLKRNPAGPAFLSGSSVTIADVDLWDLIDQQLPLIPDLLAAAPSLAALYKSVGELPKVKAYLDSKPAHRGGH